jgi:hypothetical protein
MTQAEIDKLKAAKAKHPTAGRGVLARLAGVTEEQARTWLKKNGLSGVCGRQLNDGAASPAKAYKSTPATKEPVVKNVTGIALHSARVMDNRPQQDKIKRMLYQLKRGTGYPVEAIAEEWGVSEDSLRKNAKRLEALKYVEVSPGEWVLCVMHPETAEDYRKAG